MSQYTNTPATLETLIKAIEQLSSSDESTLRKSDNRGKLNESSQIDPTHAAESVGDFVSDEELIEASPMPLSIEQRVELIQASFLPSKNHEPKVEKEPSSKIGVENFYPLLQTLSALNTEDDHKPSAGEVNKGNERVFTKIESGLPATLEEVLAAIVQLREFDEATILEIVSDSRMDKLFPFELRPLVTRRNPSSPFPYIDELTPAIVTKSRS